MRTPDPGSYRDPTSRVYLGDGVVLRGLDTDAGADLDTLLGSQLWSRHAPAGHLVETEVLAAPPPELADTGWARWARHPRIDHWSYPYEWTFSMLADAARLQLTLTADALAEGMVTKDATPYNVVFVGTSPRFVDLGSFERLRPGEPWYGYQQFCELYLYPLLLASHLDLPLGPLLRGSLDGIDAETTRRLLGGRHRLHRGVLTHVEVQARAQRRHAGSTRDVQGELRAAGLGPKVLANQVASLRKVVDGLEWGPDQSTWSDYGDRGHYTDRDLEAKEAFVTATVGDHRRLVLDLGANDGRFSRLAARAADTVVAVDADPLVVERLYLDLQRRPAPAPVLPLVVDLVDISPALGWRGRERTSFIDRYDADLVLALALVHHLAISRTVPLVEITSFLADVGDDLVVEFPDRDDPMVQRLLGHKRDGLFDHYDLAAFGSALETTHHIEHTETLPSGTRHLFRARRR